jgi:hypothetical protein
MLVFMEGWSEKIGAFKKTVQRKFGKRKYGRGHLVKG